MRKIILIPVLMLAGVVIVSFRLVLVALGSAVYLYLFPWIVAEKRNHPRRNEILFVCAISAWLLIPWLAALWLATRVSDTKQIHVDGTLAWDTADD